LFAVASACAALLFSSPSFAKDYKIEAIIFKNQSLARTFEPSTYEPPLAPESKASRWQLKPSMLLEQYQAIKDSSNYLPLLFESWGQRSLPKSSAAVYPIVHPQAKGWIRVYARDLLFIQLDLDVEGYRLTETRRVKLNEKHFFDHPKFGLLMQVSRLEKKEEEKTIQTSR
jgi:hypothetical protein